MDLDGFGAADAHDVQDVQIAQVAPEMGARGVAARRSPAHDSASQSDPARRALPPSGGRMRGAPHASAPALRPLRAVWEVDPEGDERDARAEERLARLASAFGPLRRVLAALAARLVATKAHERLGYARLGDYARERPGLSARQLQELARVHRALLGLPALEHALVSNELPWSKVRLVARVATVQDEDARIARARTLPTRRLEEEIRSQGGNDPQADTEDAPPEKWVELRCTPAVREKWSLTRELAERVAGQCLRDAEALELAVAEVFSTLSIDPPFGELLGEPPPPPRWRAQDAGDGVPPPSPRAPVHCLPRSVASLTSGLDEADAFELDRRLCLGVRLERTLDAAMAPFLRRVTSAEYEWRTDYQTLSHYAREQLGMSAGKARALVRLERAGDVCPDLRDAYRNGLLSWVKAQCLVPLLLLDLDGEWRPAWVAWAERVTVRRLAADVERALLLRAGHDRAWQRCKFHPERAQDPIPADERQLCAPDVDPEATQQLGWRLPYDVAALFVAVRETLRSRLCAARGPAVSDGQAFDAMLDCALVAWTLRDPSARRPDPVIERDAYRCVVPGCTSRRNLHDHHVTFRSAGGSDEATNRVTLCAFHHQRGVHAGLLRVRGRAPDDLVFELGLRPNAPPLARYRSGDVALATDRTRTGNGWIPGEDLNLDSQVQSLLSCR